MTNPIEANTWLGKHLCRFFNATCTFPGRWRWKIWLALTTHVIFILHILVCSSGTSVEGNHDIPACNWPTNLKKGRCKSHSSVASSPLLSRRGRQSFYHLFAQLRSFYWGYANGGMITRLEWPIQLSGNSAERLLAHSTITQISAHSRNPKERGLSLIIAPYVPPHKMRQEPLLASFSLDGGTLHRADPESPRPRWGLILSQSLPSWQSPPLPIVSYFILRGSGHRWFWLVLTVNIIT